jgi:hypothetical protein
MDRNLRIISGVTLMGAMGCNASVLSLGIASYPILGGLLAQGS